MSQLGNYVHYHWSRYVKYGIKQVEKDAAPSSSIETIKNLFQQHRKNLLQEIENNKISKDIVELQDEINNASSNAYNILISALQNQETGRGLLHALLKLANKSWTDQDIDRIINDIKFDTEQQTLRYQPSKNSNVPQRSSNIGITRLEGKWHYIQTFRNTIEKLHAKAKDLNVEESYGDLFQKIDNALKQIEEEEKAFSHMIKGRRLKKDSLVANINLLISQLQSVSSINQLIQAQFAEMLGAIAASGATNIAKENLAEVLRSWVGGSRTSSDQSITFSIDLSQEWLKAQLDNQIPSPYKNYITQIKEGKTIVGYGFKQLATKVQQKVDVEWSVDVALSIKNTSFDESYETEDIIPHISLQSSALRLYLEGIEQNDTGLGTHYLNTLASHPNKNDSQQGLKSISQYSRETLLIYMLYSSLTGRGQVREGKYANVLAIYDKKRKGAQQIKLFSMYDIINILSKNISQYDGIISNPALGSFNLNNTWVDANKSQFPAKQRWTELLAETTIKTINMRIPISLLKTMTT